LRSFISKETILSYDTAETSTKSWWMLVAGNGLGEDVTNRAAARPVGAVKTKGGDIFFWQNLP